jgi:hypothetical protein
MYEHQLSGGLAVVHSYQGCSTGDLTIEYRDGRIAFPPYGNGVLAFKVLVALYDFHLLSGTQPWHAIPITVVS